MIQEKPTYYLCLTVKREKNRVLERETARASEREREWGAKDAVAVLWWLEHGMRSFWLIANRHYYESLIRYPDRHTEISLPNYSRL
ncbi:hypothetical protein L3X38_021591 [Prunus dulcis]|uniref:Uncharacterized protein n=1 Tax=Prunus dulcis TaxID=3755 RepID=A0AAD4Z3I2_PRUDU|nr:hypothetical protein L3X38_021591 [Prunus dulcis]